MTWYQQPAALDPASPEAVSRRRGRTSRITAVLFLPALVAAKVMVLATERGTACVMQGGCAPFPGVFFLALLAAVVASVVVVAAAPRRFQGPALAVQLALETIAVLMVLAYP
ncbi:hypothetical protein AB0B01_01985 [Streptomyces sp. NPDC044571]|uniref:hypothetical protein n=1 Tax=Streptomyces sp. NPDC044571 TaxID=3155371 RepID=UPI0033E8BCC2